MKRRKRLLIVLLVLVLLLGGTYAVTVFNPENGEEETVSETVFTVNTADVTAIGWDYREPLAFHKTEEGWAYDSDPAFPLDETYLKAMLEEVEEITASKTIENVEDWDPYSLEVPICQVTVTAGGTTYTLKIGEETALGGERYLSIGDGNAYLVDADILAPFCYGLYDILKMESPPEMDSVLALEMNTADAYRIDHLENSGLAYSDAYVWFVENRALDTDLTEDLLANATALNWQECADYNATGLSQYGLDTPAGTIRVYYLVGQSGGTYALEIGAACDGGYYARLADSGMVYTISSGVAETLLHTTPEELLPDEVLLMDWEQVTAIDISLDGETHTVTRSTETVTGDEGDQTEETVYRLSGETVDAQGILDALDALDATGYATSLTPQRREEIRFTIHRNHKTFPEVELAFYRYSSASCLVTLNGEATVFVSREAVVDLTEEVIKLLLS